MNRRNEEVIANFEYVIGAPLMKSLAIVNVHGPAELALHCPIAELLVNYCLTLVGLLESFMLKG